MTREAIQACLAERRFDQARAALLELIETDRSERTLAFVGRCIDALARAPGLCPASVYVLRSITLEPLAPRLRAQAFRAGLDLTVSFGGFDQFEQEIAGQGALPAAAPTFVVVAARLDELAPELTRCFVGTPPVLRQQRTDEALARIETWLGQLRARWPESTVLVHGFEVPNGAFGLAEPRVETGQRRFVQALNRRLGDLCRARPGVFLIDLEAVIAEVGRRHAYDARMWAHGRLPYSTAALDALAAVLARAMAAVATPRRKCVVLDCDNTLWGGVVGEDGPDGIALGPDHPGSAYVAFQDRLRELADRGSILALCTKNNEADVLRVLDEHPFQVLRRDAFAAWRINWQDKASNLEVLAAELNLGLDALIFIDDNDFECELVRRRLPAVEVVQAPDDPLRLSALVERLTSLDVLDWSAEDARRGQMYQAEAARAAARPAAGSLDDYLRSLGLRLEIGWTGPAQIGRVAQLTRKTNQFNLTTRRYSDQEIEALVARPDRHVVHAHLSDRFGAAGLTAVLILHEEDHALHIDTFLMSCRIIGRGVERALLSWVLAFARARGARTVTGEYRPTEKNQQTRDFYRDFGFEPLADGRWRWPLERPVPAAPDWFELALPDGALAA